MEWNELIRDTAWVVEDILNQEECQHFLQRAREEGIDTMIAAGDVRHRNSRTVSVDDEEMAQRIFDRILPHLPKEVRVDENCDNLGLLHSKKDLYGVWKPYKLNSRWRVVCYPGMGHFGPHRDGSYVEDENHRSLITLNGYLTDRPSGCGGCTRFLKDEIGIYEQDGIFTTPDDAILHRVEADKAGKAVVFFHDLMHDGEPLKEGSPPKWLFRTEIMYERDPDSAPSKTKEEIDAQEFLKKAEQAEENGDISGATKFYKMAYRLDPSLE